MANCSPCSTSIPTGSIRSTRKISAGWKKSWRCFAGRRAAANGGPRAQSSVILRVAKSQHREEDERQDQHADRKSDTLAKPLRDVDEHDDPNDEVHEGNEHQDEPPDRSAGDLETHDD